MARWDHVALVLDGTYDTVQAALDDARVELLAAGNSEWDVDLALRRVEVSRAHWSPSYSGGKGGFVHDCGQHTAAEHDPAQCHDDAATVTVVAPLPDSLRKGA